MNCAGFFCMFLNSFQLCEDDIKFTTCNATRSFYYLHFDGILKKKLIVRKSKAVNITSTHANSWATQLHYFVYIFL
jgi:hypothetical protein